MSQPAGKGVPADLEKTLKKNDSNVKAANDLILRAESLVAERLPEKHEHTPLNKKMSDFTRRNSQDNSS
ncbi:hypothetical protein, conserved [Eimeria praecox]|uniref:Uncharacterized protein n=1 Tax=Eimeria praecox TaxID=51316 RepID=U6GYA9_9EIME|nr:hypothetical protein, conserved [Eimeria praecox]